MDTVVPARRPSVSAQAIADEVLERVTPLPRKEEPVVKRNLALEAYDRLVATIQKRKDAGEEEEHTALASARRWALRVVAIFTSLSCAVTSVYFSNIWFAASQPRFIAAIMALTVVATLTVAPELSVALARKRRYLTALVVMAISVVATVFSMSSTVGGIYNARSTALVVSREVPGVDKLDGGLAAKTEINNLAVRIERLKKVLEADQGTASSYQAAIDDALRAGGDPLSKSMATLVANRSAAVRRVSVTEVEISAAEKRINDLVPLASAYAARESEHPPEREDFALWLGQRFGLSADQMEFLLAVFPAVFIDVIAPAMLVVAFAL